MSDDRKPGAEALNRVNNAITQARRHNITEKVIMCHGEPQCQIDTASDEVCPWCFVIDLQLCKTLAEVALELEQSERLH